MITPSWDFPRNPFGAFVVVEVGEEAGLPASRALAGTGLRRDDLMRADAEIAAGQELAVIRNVLRALGDAGGIGAQAGARMTLGMAGVWAFAMFNSRTVRDAVNIALRFGYGHFSFVYARPFVQLHRTELHIELDTGELPADLHTFLVLRDLAAQVAVARQILGDGSLVRAETTVASAHIEHLAALVAPRPLIAGCARDVLVLPAGILDTPLPAADEFARRRWTEMLETTMARHDGRRTASEFVSAVRAMMLRDPRRPPSLEDVAQAVVVSPRSLRRKLADAGTSFRSELDGVRRTIADDLLGDGLSVTEVSFQMGYADAASFSRAYKRWTGRRPGQSLAIR